MSIRYSLNTGLLHLLVGSLRHAVQLQCHQIERLAIVETEEFKRDTKGPTYNIDWPQISYEMFYALPLIGRSRLEGYGPKIAFIKGIHKTVADQSHGLSMPPVSIKQLRATLQRKSIRSKSSQRQNWTAVSNTMAQTKSSHQQTWRL